MLLYCLILLILLLIFVTTFHYHWNDYKHLPLKEHPLKILYGMPFFLLNTLDKTKNGSQLSKRDKKLSTKLSKLYIGINPKLMVNIYKSRIIASIYVILFVFSVLGLIVNISSVNKNSNVTSLSRPTDGSPSETHQLTAVIDGETTDIILEVESAAYSLEQALSYFDQHRENIENSLLNHNTSLYEISSDISFSSRVDDINIFWEIEDSNYLDYDGHINMANIPNAGVLTNLYATLTYKGHSATITIPIFIQKVADLTSPNDTNIQSQLESENSIYESNVSLPTNVNGHTIKYYEKDEELTLPF